MIAALLFAATSAQTNIKVVELSRGALIQPSDSSAKPFRYWDTSDTFIDGSSVDENFGGEPVLAGGPTKTVLIRFGDLNRAVGSYRRVRSATLFLTIAGGDKPTLKSIEQVRTPWGAGPYFTINALISRNMQAKPSDKKPIVEQPGPPRWSATWRHPFAGDGGTSWQLAGANGPQDADPISGAKLTASEKVVAIEGLSAAVQKMIDTPVGNNGFCLRFQNECEFFASRAAVGQPRLELELEPIPPATGADLSITSIQRISSTGSQPSDGAEVTYRAHIKNVGNEKSGGFSAVWTINGKSGATFDVTDNLAPGTETSVTTHSTFRLDKLDHRTQTISLKITPSSADAVSANNALLVYPNARQIDVVVPDSIAKQAALNLVGSHSIEDWVQEQIRLFNDAYAAQSRFSFAPDGAKERVAVQHIVIGAEKPADGNAADGIATMSESGTEWFGADPAFLRSVALAAGLPDFTTMSFPLGNRVMLKQGDQPFFRGSEDLYPGVVGYGDTRYDGAMAGAMSLQYEPFPASTPGLIPLVPLGLLSATDVQILNSRLGRVETPLLMPKTTLIRACDLTGRPLGNLQLDLFQSKDGQIPSGPPSLTLITSQIEGTCILPNRDGAGPFGKLDSNGGNGTYLIRATANGKTEYGWLKAWQVIDTASRGNVAAGVLEVRFNLPSALLDSEINLARDRIITDSTNLLPAKLAPLVSDSNKLDVDLGSKVGDWIEVDLGRDRTIGEISLVAAAGAFWRQFDVMVYTTGQKADEATPWTKETDWTWTSSNRRDPVPGDSSVVSVSYCAPTSRIRFIRIISRSNSSGKLRSIRVTPIKVSQ